MKGWSPDKTLIPRIAQRVRGDLGVNLGSDDPADTRHGYLLAIHKAPGLPFITLGGYEEIVSDEGLKRRPFTEDVDDCPHCGKTIPRADAHECVKVVLYEQDEDPNEEHRTTIRVPQLALRQREEIEALVRRICSGEVT